MYIHAAKCTRNAFHILVARGLCETLDASLHSTWVPICVPIYLVNSLINTLTDAQRTIEQVTLGVSTL